MKKVDYYPKVLSLLRELKKLYPSWEMGRHLSSATSDYGDTWGLPDKELYHSLCRYKEDILNAQSSDDIFINTDFIDDPIDGEEEDF